MDRRQRILVIDDEPDVVSYLSAFLEDEGFQVLTAGNGPAGLTLARDQAPDLITLDITMPEIDGLTVLEEMLKLNDKVKVMVVTALSDKSTGLKAIKLGAKSFLPKPFTPEKLRSSFERLLD